MTNLDKMTRLMDEQKGIAESLHAHALALQAERDELLRKIPIRKKVSDEKPIACSLVWVWRDGRLLYEHPVRFFLWKGKSEWAPKYAPGRQGVCQDDWWASFEPPFTREAKA